MKLTVIGGMIALAVVALAGCDQVREPSRSAVGEASSASSPGPTDDEPTDDETTGDEQDRAEILRAASGMVDAFLDVDYRAMDQTRDRVLGLATGRFHEEYRSTFAGLTALAEGAESVQRGQVLSARLVSATGDRATALVRARATVTNNAAERPVEHLYRVRLTLRLVDGGWLTDGLRLTRGPGLDERSA